MKTITTFGGSNAPPEVLVLAEELGKRIAYAGYALKNGGYDGTMEATARGCRQAGGVVIGVCIQGNFNNRYRPNQYNSSIIFAENIDDRINQLMVTDAIVILPGHTGTLEELFKVWNAMRNAAERKPVYLLGKKNVQLFDFLTKHDFVSNAHLPCVKPVESLEDIDVLNNPHLLPKRNSFE